MHSRRVASFLLGAWLLGSLLLLLSAVENARSVERVLTAPLPGAANLIKSAGTEAARQMLLHQAVEHNMLLRSAWGAVEIGIGLALIAVLCFATSVNRIVVGGAGVMVLLAIFLHFVLLPESYYITRSSMAAGAAAPQGMRLLYAGLEALKVLVGCSLAVYLFVHKGPSRREARREVGHAHHGHISW